jgi:hypothetical protein
VANPSPASAESCSLSLDRSLVLFAGRSRLRKPPVTNAPKAALATNPETRAIALRRGVEGSVLL